MANIIGLRVYRFTIRREFSEQRLTDDRGPTDFLSFFRSYVHAYTNAALNNGESKTIRFEPEPEEKHIEHGIIRYGKYGFGAKIEDVATGEEVGERSPRQAETIPIYYRVWCQPGKPYALIGLQSYGQMSCVDLFKGNMGTVFNRTFADYNLGAEKLMPNDMALYSDKVVKKISLIKKDARAASLRPSLQPDGTDRVDLDLQIIPKGKGAFGRLRDIEERLGENLAIDELEFEGAFASIKVGKNQKRVGVLGLSSSSGVIDVTDDISLDQNMHPEIGSISRVFEGHMADFARDLG